MPIEIQHRRGTASAWASANPVLGAGEPAYETDTAVQKIGDGTTHYSGLPGQVNGASAPIGGGVVYLPAPSGDSSGATDTTNFNAALALLPTVTVWGDPRSGTGTSIVYPIGTLNFRAAPAIVVNGAYEGTPYYFSGNHAVGPFVELIGPGSTACRVACIGGGDTFRLFNGVVPNSGGEATVAARMGRVDGLTIDGTLSSVGSVGLHIGDIENVTLGPDLVIENFNKPVISPPVITLGTTSSSGGTMAAGTQFWVLEANVGTTGAGETTPSNELTATPGSGGTQVINWTPVTGATSYTLYRGTVTGTETTLVAVIPGGSSATYTDTGSSIGTTKVQARNTASSMGILFDIQTWWINNLKGSVSLANNTQQVLFNCGGQATGATNLGGAIVGNRLQFNVTNLVAQNILVLQKGVLFHYGELNFTGSTEPAGSTDQSANAGIIIQGTELSTEVEGGQATEIAFSDLVFNVNSNAGSTHKLQTIFWDSVTANRIRWCRGSLIFSGNNSWSTTNWTVAGSGANGNFTFAGLVQGDTNLIPGDGNALVVMGPLAYGLTEGFAGSGNIAMNAGDIMTPLTLTKSITVALTMTNAGAWSSFGPRRITLLFKQPSGGNNWTVTLPVNGSPTTSSPTFVPMDATGSGTVFSMPTTTNAIGWVNAVTSDCITWYYTWGKSAA